MAARPLALALSSVLLLVWACTPRARTDSDKTTVTPSAAAAIACPAGTSLAGAGPPSGASAWCVDAQGRQHGPAVEWFDDGAKRSEGEYDQGRLHGAWRSYYASGAVRSAKAYLQGRPTGTWTTFFADGSPSTVHVHTGDDAARVTEYGPDRRKLREGGMVAGARHGAWSEWDAAGNEVRSTWDHGKLVVGTSGAGAIGIAECDEYVTKYARCIMDHVPEAARSTMQQGMNATIAAWREAAAGPGRDGLPTTCKAALDAGKQSTSAMGCEW